MNALHLRCMNEKGLPQDSRGGRLIWQEEEGCFAVGPQRPQTSLKGTKEQFQMKIRLSIDSVSMAA
jgi:hypothetical protein